MSSKITKAIIPAAGHVALADSPVETVLRFFAGRNCFIYGLR